MMRDVPHGLWSNELCCFVSVRDITDSPLVPTLKQVVLVFHNAYAAVASIPQVVALSGLDESQIEALAIREEDRPESNVYFPLRSTPDVERMERMSAM